MDSAGRKADKLLDDMADGSMPGNRFRSGWLAAALIAVLAGTVFFSGLGGTRLWDRDEPRNAGCAAEMLREGNWIVPRFNDQLRHQKPVLTYWLMISAYQVFGVNEFAARFWSAALGVATCLMVWRIGVRIEGERTGLWGALILPGTVMFTVAARAATPDLPLIFCWTAAMWVFAEAGAERWRRSGDCEMQAAPWFRKNWQWLAFYLLIGLGALAKGLAGVLPPLLICGLFLWSSVSSRGESLAIRLGPLSWWRVARAMRLPEGLLVAGIVAAPWYIAVDRATGGEFTRLFFVREHFGRATTAFEGHSGGPWYYPLAWLAGFFPWSLLAVPASLELWRQRRDGIPPGRRFLLFWICATIALFSLARTKLPSYITPCFPASALLIGGCVADWSQGNRRIAMGWLKVTFAVLLLCGAGVATALLWLARDRAISPWIGVAAVPLIAAGFFLVWNRNHVRPADWPRWLAGSALVFQCILFGWAATLVDATRETGPMFASIRSASPEVPVAAWRCLESSWVWYGGRPIVELVANAATANGENRDSVGRSPTASPAEFASRPEGGLIIVPEQNVAELRELAGQRLERVVEVPDFLRDRRLVLLRVEPGIARARQGEPLKR